MSAERITEDMVEDLQQSLVLGRATGEQLRRRAEIEYAWATDSVRYELDARMPASAVLALAAEDFLAAGEGDRALEVALEARASAGPDDFTAHPTLVEVRLGRGEVEAAKAVAEEARKRVASDPELAERIGDAFELADRPALAERWYTIGLRGLSRAEGRFWSERLLRDRHRVRRDQAKTLDAMDEEYEEIERTAHPER